MELVEIIKKTFKKLAVRSILLSIILIVVAILLITNPEKVLALTVIVAGVALILDSIAHISVYLGQSPEIRAMSSDFIIGIAEIVTGILFIVNKTKVISIFYIIIGVWLIMEAIQKAQMVLNLKDYISHWAITIIVALVDLVLGILVITHPYDAGTSITQVTGIILLVSEGINLIESIYTLFRVKKIGKKVQEIIKDKDE